MNDYTIAIPTFERPKILFNKTLALLETHNINPNKIIIFLKDIEQKNKYEGLDNYKVVLTDCNGIGETRNYLQTYFYERPEYTNVLFIDDDMTEIMDYDKPIKDLNSFIIEAFKETKKRNLNIWGVSAFHNTFFLKHTITTNLKYICGAFFGEIFDRTKDEIHSDMNHYEDFDKSLLHFERDGGVVRFNYIALITKYFGEGGINESYKGIDNRKKDMEAGAYYMKDKWGDAVKVIQKNYGYDLRLNHHYKN